ncbi:MAG: hypothetical protein AB1629_04500 [Candidatus Omnitrophota bacterium]
MKRLSLIILISLLFFLPPLEAAVPHLVRYQGYLTDSGGTALNGSYNLKFRIYNASTGGTMLWSETQTGVQVSNGTFTVLLGQVNPLNLSFNSDCWISIEVNSDGEMTPRQRITSVPYAYNAEKVDNIASANIVQTTTNQAIDGIKTFLQIPILPANNPTQANQAVRKAYVDSVIPSGTIILFSGGSCPAGYTRLSALDGKFLVGGVNYNPTAGGSNSHTHAAGSYAGPSHTHTVPASTGNWGPAPGGTNVNNNLLAENGYGRATQDLPTAASGTGAIVGTSATADSRPEFATILCCQKD